MPNRRLKFLTSSKPLFILLFLAVSAVPSQALDRQTAAVREVLTGDTLRLEGGKTLKYIGVQSPPLQHLIPLVREYGHEALAFNQSLVQSKKIWIEWGSQLRDDQNNLLGYVHLEDGTFVNLEILRQGHGKLVRRPPNTKYFDSLRKAELEARRKKLGLWKKEPDNPFIKSEYIGDKVTKTYYFPTSPELDEIPGSQLVTFQSRVEAKAAGYRPCFTCKEHSEDSF
jgi:micrococcal nuclease